MVRDAEEGLAAASPASRVPTRSSTPATGVSLNHSTSDSGADDVAYRLVLARTRASVLGMAENPVRVGRYQIDGQLGAGGMGVVYSARDERLDRRVAIKLLHADVARGDAGRARLLREAQAMARLSHPNVAHVYEVGYHDDKLFVAMEFIEGRTLGRWGDLDHHWRDIVDMHIRAGRGLAAAHAVGLIHRDYKLANVLVGDDGRPRVLDFGLARSEHDLGGLRSKNEGVPTRDGSMDSVDITATGTVLGTPAYMAPEQLRGEELDARADQFSFCVGLFEALYGVRPFPGATLTELIRSVLTRDPVDVVDGPRVPRAVRALLVRGLHRDQRRRFASMDDLLASLQALLADRGGARWRAWGLGVALVAGLGSAGYAVATQPGQGESQPVAGSLAAAPEPAPEEDSWTKTVAASHLPPVQEVPADGDVTKVTVHRLRNGLTIYVAPRTNATFVHARTLVLAGEADERAGEGGIANLVQRAIESGSDRLGTHAPVAESVLRDEQRRLIGELASTDDDDVKVRNALLQKIVNAEAEGAELAGPHYSGALTEIGAEAQRMVSSPVSERCATVPRSRLNAWIDLNAEILRRPVFRTFVSDVRYEIDALAEAETRDPVRRASAAAFLPEAAGHTHEAIAANLARIPLAEAEAFYTRYYWPNNTAIILVGDLVPAQVLPHLEAAFGSWEPAATPATPEPRAPNPTASPIQLATLGVTRVTLAFGLPGDPMDKLRARSLVQVLSGRDGLLKAQFARSEEVSFASARVMPHSIHVTAGVPKGSSHEAVERELRAALKRIGNGEVSEADWHASLASRRFQASSWASSPRTLADHISASFVERRAWATTAAELTGDADALDRETLEAAARSLLAQPVRALHATQGRVVGKVSDPLPRPQVTPQPHGALGEFARSIVEREVTWPEPQFIVAGRGYTERKTARGRATLVRAEGPRFQLTSYLSVGLADDPRACIAIRALAQRARSNRTFVGADLTVLCGVDETQVRLIGLHSDLTRLSAVLETWLETGVPSDDDAHAAVSSLRDGRAQAAADARTLDSALRIYGLRGERGASAMMPRAAALRAATPADLRSGLALLRASGRDLGYVGADPDGFAATLGAPPSEADAPTDDPSREHAASEQAIEQWLAGGGRPEIFAVHHAQSPEVRIAFALRMPPTGTPKQRVLNRIFAAGPDAPPQPGEDKPLWSITPVVGLRAVGPDVKTILYFAPYDQLGQALHRGLGGLRLVPDESQFLRYRESVEREMRQYRADPMSIPDIVRSWRRRGYVSDPLIAQWLGLPAATHADGVAHMEWLGQTSPVVTLVGDRDRIDHALLERVGEVRWLEPARVVGDPNLDALEWFGSIGSIGSIDSIDAGGG